MFYAMITSFFGLFVDLLVVKGKPEHHKDLEIAFLRQQLRIVHRRQMKAPTLPHWQKLPLAALASRLKNISGALQLDALLFKPATLLHWHRELVRRKWTFKKRAMVGRPRLTPELESLIVKLAKENTRFGFGKLQGELKKLGYEICKNSIENVLKPNGLPTSPERRNNGMSWQRFLSHYQGQILACDFFTVETAWLKTICVLLSIELDTRRVHFAGCTAQPNSAWLTQQARQMTWVLEGREPAIRYLIHDRDTKFSSSFKKSSKWKPSTLF